MENLRNNPSIEINVVDPFSRRGYRFKGTTEIISNGEQYDKLISSYRSLGIKSSIKSVVLVRIQKVSEVTSPLYDIGYTEEEMKDRWKKYYLSF